PLPLMAVYGLLDAYPVPLGKFTVDFVIMDGDEALMDLIDEEDHRFWSLFYLESYLSKTSREKTPRVTDDPWKYIQYVAFMQQSIPLMITGKKPMPARKMVLERLTDKPAGFQALHTLIQTETAPPTTGNDWPIRQWWDKQGLEDACLRGMWTFEVDSEKQYIEYNRRYDLQCVGRPRFEVIDILIVYVNKDASHANIVLIDNNLETVEYFEPDTDRWYPHSSMESIYQVIKDHLRSVWNIPDAYRVMHPLDLCIHVQMDLLRPNGLVWQENMQTNEPNLTFRSIGPQGYGRTFSTDPCFKKLNEHTCLFWCLFYVTESKNHTPTP
ncbi:hypothetical protein HK102_014045, partial [Quaeritorhiza haematococci]